MDINSKECEEALKNYPVTNDIEKMAVKILTTKVHEIRMIPGFSDMTAKHLDELGLTIRKIRVKFEIIGDRA